MTMKNLIDPFWIGVTIILSIFFAIMLPVSIIEKHGTAKTIVFTVLGIIFIWVTYFVRAYFFSDKKEQEHNKNKNHFHLLVVVLLLLFAKSILGQDTSNHQTIFPEGISIEYGIGSYAVTDEYISAEKYSGSLPYYSIAWSNQHSNYVYHLKIDFGNSSEIKNNNVSADIFQFTLNQGFSYALPKFTLFDNEAYLYLGPSTELFFYYNEQNIAVSGFDYSKSFALLISAGINSQLFYKLWNNFNIEGTLDFNIISLGFRMVDDEETDESPAKLLTLISANNIVFTLGPRYYMLDNLSIKAAYLFHLTRIDSWEPLLSASDNVVFTLTYGF